VTAELLALLHDSRLANDKNLKKLLVHVEWENQRRIIHKIDAPIKRDNLFYYIIKQCRELICSMEWYASIEHCCHEANGIADCLADLGVELHSPTSIFEFPPGFVKEILYEADCVVSRPHLVHEE